MRRSAFSKPVDQSGINMVDLMMWLVIAALLLAAALQSIGFYQKAAFSAILQSDLSGVGANVMAGASSGGSITATVASDVTAESKWSTDVTHRVESSSTGTPYIRASHPSVTAMDAIYLFEDCGSLGAGVHMVPKSGSVELASCGMGASTVGISIQSAGLSWDEYTNLGNQVWYGMAMSADTKVRVATGDNGGYLRISTDSGETWKTRTDLGAGRWRSVDMSSDGQTIIAADITKAVWISTDTGRNWTKKSTISGTFNSYPAWHAVTVSDDGTRMAALDGSGSSGYLYTSSDSGSTWVRQAGLGAGKRYGLATSADGKKMVTATYVGDVYTSNDYGVTWTQQVGSGPGNWFNFSSSADGQKLVGTDRDDNMKISHDGGLTWTKTLTSEIKFYAVSASADGNILVAGQWDTTTGYLWTSKDAGLTWTKNTELGAAGWRGGTISKDGTKILAGHFKSGFLYFGTYK